MYILLKVKKSHLKQKQQQKHRKRQILIAVGACTVGIKSVQTIIFLELSGL